MKTYRVRIKDRSFKVRAEDENEAFTKVRKKLIKDAVSLKRGDWFTFRGDRRKLYKLIDDKLQSRNGFSKSLLAEEYNIDYNWKDLSDDTLKIQKTGTTTLYPNLDNIIVFNSANEALKWFRMQLKIINNRK